MIQNGHHERVSFADPTFENVRFKTSPQQETSYGDLGVSKIVADPSKYNFKLKDSRMVTFQDADGAALHPLAQDLATNGFIRDDYETIKCHYCETSPSDFGLHDEVSLCAFNRHRQIGPARPASPSRANGENVKVCCCCKAAVAEILISCRHLLCPTCCEQTLYCATCPVLTCDNQQVFWLKRIYFH